jgi:serine/threonine protein phosphatase 1
MDAPSLPPGRRVYAIGDIHGEADLLTSLLQAIREDARQREPATVTLVFLGDFIDRGKQSAALLKVFLLRSDDAVKVLKGNYEAAGRRLSRRRGGLSFLAPLWRPTDTRRARGEHCGRYGRDAGAAARDARRGDHRLARRGAALLEPRRLLFTHARIRPRVRLARQDPNELLWIREPFLSSKRRHDKIIVHGHTVESGSPVLGGNRIAIDTGAHGNGCLAALGLEGSAQWLIQASDGRDRVVTETLG